MLYNGSNVSIHEASSIVALFCSRFNLSDEGSGQLHSIFKAVLPENNIFPSGSSYVQSVKRNFSDQVKWSLKTPEETVFVLNFRLQLQNILRKNLNQIMNYTEHRKRNPSSDLRLYFCPPVELSANSFNINLIVFTEGVNIKKSTYRKELWPIWIQIADLPPKLRMARKNMVLASLFVGSKLPEWNVIVPHIQGELLSNCTINLSDDFSVHIVFTVKLIVCDLGAKGHVLNMMKFNGFFGCHYCTVEGRTIGRIHSYYPFQQCGSIREPQLNDVYVNIAEAVKSVEDINIVGVKGKSAFACLLSGLPLTAPVDYMHCVLSGVFPELLKLCWKNISSRDQLQIDEVVSNFNCPREMISYSRKIRLLSEVGQFKANEFFNWLFYISVPMFLDLLPSKIYSHLCNLVFGIRLLLESSEESQVTRAEELLNNFCRDIVEIHDGQEKIETINVHSLRHLSDQVRRFGPLYCYSALSFESANRTLGEVFTGANSECEVICRRFLQKHRLAHADITNPNLQHLFDQLTGQQKSEPNYADGMKETDALREGKLNYPDAEFFNRQVFEDTYFDSTSFIRSKLGNCYVHWVEGVQLFFGEVQYFVQIQGPPFYNQMQAVVRFFEHEDVGPVNGFIYKVRKTEQENLVPIQELKKVFHFQKLISRDGAPITSSFMVKLCSCFEHS